MTPNIIDGLIFMALIGVLLLATHLSAVCLEKSNTKRALDRMVETNPNSLEGEK